MSTRVLRMLLVVRLALVAVIIGCGCYTGGVNTVVTALWSFTAALFVLHTIDAWDR